MIPALGRWDRRMRRSSGHSWLHSKSEASLGYIYYWIFTKRLHYLFSWELWSISVNYTAVYRQERANQANQGRSTSSATCLAQVSVRGPTVWPPSTSAFCRHPAKPRRWSGKMNMEKQSILKLLKAEYSGYIYLKKMNTYTHKAGRVKSLLEGSHSPAFGNMVQGPVLRNLKFLSFFFFKINIFAWSRNICQFCIFNVKL